MVMCFVVLVALRVVVVGCEDWIVGLIRGGL